MDLQQANNQAAAIQAAIENGSLSKSNALAQLHLLADQVSATAQIGATGLFYSGSYRTVGGAIIHSEDVARAIAEASGGSFVRLNDVDVGRFLEGEAFEDALRAATATGTGNAALDELAFRDALGKDPQTSFFGRASARFASELSGPAVSLTGNAQPDRVYAQVELNALLENPNVAMIDGMARHDLLHLKNTRGLAAAVEMSNGVSYFNGIENLSIGVGQEGVYIKLQAAFGTEFGISNFDGIDTSENRFTSRPEHRTAESLERAVQHADTFRRTPLTLAPSVNVGVHRTAAVAAGRAVTRLFDAGTPTIIMAAAVHGVAKLIADHMAETGLSFNEARESLGIDLDIQALAIELGIDIGASVVPLNALRHALELLVNVDDAIALVRLYAEAYPDNDIIRELARTADVVADSDAFRAYLQARDWARAEISASIDWFMSLPAGSYTIPQQNGQRIPTRWVLEWNEAFETPGDELVVIAFNKRWTAYQLATDADGLLYLPRGVNQSGVDALGNPVFALDGRRVFVQYGWDVGTGDLIRDPQTGAAIPARLIEATNSGAIVKSLTGPDEGSVYILRSDGTGAASSIADVLNDPEWHERAAILINADIAQIQDIEVAGQFGRQLASILGGALPISDPFARAAASSVIATIGENVAEAIQAGGVTTTLTSHDITGNIYNVLDNFFPELGANLASAGIGAISSALVADLIDSLGLEGALVGDFAQSAGSQYLSTIVSNLPQLTSGSVELGDLLQGVNLGNIAGGFIGAQLASKLVQFDTIGGQIGASVGSSAGMLYSGKALAKIGVSVAGPIGAAVGAFVGYILGGLIGSLFGGRPKAGAALGWDEGDQRFEVGGVWSKHGGAKDAVRSAASQVGELLNGVIAASGARLVNAGAVQTGAYEIKGDAFAYKAHAGADAQFTTKDAGALVNHGAFIALSDLSARMIGGDVYVKRAVAATLAHAGGDRNAAGYAAGAFEAQALFGNIATAQDYASYLRNASVINALIAAEPQSAFSAGWTITFARAMELGLDRRWKSDWQGGWAAFLDETADGVVDGAAFTPGNVFLELDPDTNERLFVFVDADGALLGVLGDTIDTASKDVIAATNGNDALTVNGDTITLTSAHTLNGAAASAGAHKIRVAALIDGGAGNDVIRGGDLGNDLLGGDGNDTLIGGKLDDWLFGGAGNDKLFAGAVADPNSSNEAALVDVDGGNGDVLDGGAGDDALYGGRGSDWLIGGAGVDRLVGGDGGDILDGGEGDDRGPDGAARLFGGAGSDQYLFYYGAGHDVVFDASDPSYTPGAGLFTLRQTHIDMEAGAVARNWAGDGRYEVDGSVVGGEDAIVFGPGIDFRNLVMRRPDVGGDPGADLVIELSVFDETGARVMTGDSLTIKDWFDEARRVEWLRFANGEEIRIGDISSFIVGTGGADVIIGSYGSDFILGEDGDDVIYGLSGNDFGFGGRGRDFISGDEDNDWVLGGDDDDQVMGGAGNDTVFGDSGDDTVFGGSGADIVVGGRGDDIVVGGAGDDLFRYARGDGRDIMFDNYVNNWELVFDANLGAGHEFTNGYQLVGGQVIKNGVVYFDDGAWIGLYDWRNAQGRLYRHLGANGAGDATENAGVDTLEFGIGIDIEDVQLRRSGDDLVLAISSGPGDGRAFADIGDAITLREWFRIDKQIERFVFTETGVLDTRSFAMAVPTGSDGDDALTGNAGRNWMTGGLGDDLIEGLGGDDILSGNFGADRLLGGAGADVLYGGEGNDVLDGGAGADHLFGGAGVDIASYASNTGSGVGVRVSLARPAWNTLDAVGDTFSGVEGLEGTARNDHLSGDGGANVLIGGAGADVLQGGGGDDDYEWDIGDGDDIIRDQLTTPVEIISAAGALNTAIFTAAWTYLGPEDMFGGVWHAYRLVVTRNVDGAVVYQSRDGVDFLYASAQAGPPAPSAWPFSNGQWKLGAGRTGQGVQTVLETSVAGGAGADTLILGAGVSLSDISAAREAGGQNLRLSFAQGGSVLIEGQANADTAIERMLLADGLIGDLRALKLAGEAGTANDDFFLGDAAANTFNGGAGDDVIAGGAGDDTLSGGDGDDTLEGGAGADVLDGGADSVTLDHAARAGNMTAAYGDTIRYVRSGAGVAIDLASGVASGGDAAGDTILNIENVIGSENYGDVLRGDDGANQLAGLGGDDTLDGRGGDDVLIGGAGDDTIFGGDGDDNITGDDGNDVIDAGAGDDIVAGGDGADIIHGGAGRDTIDGGASADQLHGGADDDQLSGGAGDDVLYGDAGDDKLHGGAGDDTLEGGDGADTLVGAEGADILKGGAGDDAYIFDLMSGHDQIVDASGVNSIVFAGARFDRMWLARNGDDLRIGVIGADVSVTVKHYYATSNASRMHTLTAGERTLYLAHAGALVTTMGAVSIGAPSAMPPAVSALLSAYWHLDGKAAPIVATQNVATDEDVPLNGAVAAVDHDDQTLSYELASAPAHGAVTLDANTGAWSFTPAPDWFGATSFAIRVRDPDGHSVVQTINVTVAPINDAPSAIIAPIPLEAAENAAHETVIGAFGSTDPDPGDTALYTLVDDAGGRFAISLNGVLSVAGALDFEAQASHDIVVRATDAAGLWRDQLFTVSLVDVDDVFVGTSGDDVLVGQSGRDIMSGLAGADTLASGAGDDDLFGHEGDDVLDAGAGDDLLDGGEGDDLLLGRDGADTLLGGDGDDVLVGGAGADTLTGGAGFDTLSYEGSAQGVNVNLATGAVSGGDAQGDTLIDAFEALVGSDHDDILIGSSAAERIDGGDGDDSIYGGGGHDVLIGGSGDDYLEGGDGADEIHGGDGNDVIIGGAGADLLYGGAGNDIIYAQGGGDLLEGGAGDDILDGDVGSDRYVFDDVSGHDIIRDFDPDGADADQINFRGVDAARLWFERTGGDLKISVIGADASVLVEDWFIGAGAGNSSIEFLITNTQYTIDANGLVDLMAPLTKPANQGALDTLMADSIYASDWAEFWGVNQAPVFAPVGAQSGTEDQSVAVSLDAEDDFTDANLLRYEVAVFSDAGLTQPNVGVLAAGAPFNVSGAAGAQTLTLNLTEHVSGVFYARVRVFDLTDRVSEQVFALTIDPVADAPIISLVAPLAVTLDSGSLGLNIQASLRDLDGSEVLEVTVAGLPAGLALNKGTHLGGGVWSLTAAQLAGLAITGPVDWAEDLSLTITATARETATGLTASVQNVVAVPVNARPTAITPPSPLLVNENAANGTSIGAFQAVDPDSGDTAIYAFAIVAGVTQNAGGRFAINATTGALTVANGALLDHEINATHTIRIRVTDSGGLWREDDFVVGVGDVNEAPTDIIAPLGLAVDENVANGTVIGAGLFEGVDPDHGETFTFSLLDSAGGRFAISANGRLSVANGALLDREAPGGAAHSITVLVTDADGLHYDKNFSVAINNVNEAPVFNWAGLVKPVSGSTWASSTRILTIPESTPGGGAVNIAQVVLTDVDSAQNSLRYELTNNANGRFTIGQTNGWISLISPMDYETQANGFSIDVRVWDGGQIGAGASVTGTMTIRPSNVNEAPTLTPYTRTSTAPGSNGLYVGQPAISDPEGATSFTWQIVSITSDHAPPYAAYSINSSGQIYCGYATGSAWRRQDSVVVRATDPGGLSTTTTITFIYNSNKPWAPIVFDLDGDGLELVSASVSNVAFDIDGDGVADPTGWVGADDGLLALDRDNDGLITHGDEIAFARDSEGAVSDLEGLRAFDTNENGFFDAGDAQFADFRIWQDANQDGVSQEGELTTLAQRGIAAINLTLTLTGATTEGMTDNVVYGTAEYIGADGAIGLVGDVYLAFGETTGQLPPIVLDLNGGGIDLVGRTSSNVWFDADNDGRTQRTGWFGAGEGVLALDRNGDGLITRGAEISFADDTPGALTDLEGLAAYDTNANGFFDAGDAQFADFRVWRDANQDGVSQADELNTLAHWDIVAINLTPLLTGAALGGAENVLYATTHFVRGNGETGLVGDVALAFDKDGAGEAPMAAPDARRDLTDKVSRLARNQERRRPETTLAKIAERRADPLGWMLAGDDVGEKRGPMGDPDVRRAAAPARGPTLAELMANLTDARVDASDAAPISATSPRGSALHQGLGLSDKKLLHMIDAMAGFDARGGIDLGKGRARDPRVAELLTALPDIRQS